MKIKSISD